MIYVMTVEFDGADALQLLMELVVQDNHLWCEFVSWLVMVVVVVVMCETLVLQVDRMRRRIDRP